MQNIGTSKWSKMCESLIKCYHQYKYSIVRVRVCTFKRPENRHNQIWFVWLVLLTLGRLISRAKTPNAREMFDKSFVPHFTRQYTQSPKIPTHCSIIESICIECWHEMIVAGEPLSVEPMICSINCTFRVRIDKETTTMKRQQQQQRISRKCANKIHHHARHSILRTERGVSLCLKHTAAAPVAPIYSTNICRQWMACVETIHLNDFDCVCLCQC